jgi:hypothetical protein
MTFTVWAQWQRSGGHDTQDTFDNEAAADRYARRLRSQWGIEAIVCRSDLNPFSAIVNRLEMPQ